jgi:hypothetical protein
LGPERVEVREELVNIFLEGRYVRRHLFELAAPN